MTTWTPKPTQAETWYGETFTIRTFSPLVFSHEFYNGKRVFALGISAGIWDESTSDTNIWVVE